MNMRRLGAMARKELVQVLRDPRSLMIALLMPFMQMLLLGYGVSLDIKHVPLCTWDREASQKSEALLKGSRPPSISRSLKSSATTPPSSALSTTADCRIAIVIPPDFSCAS